MSNKKKKSENTGTSGLSEKRAAKSRLIALDLDEANPPKKLWAKLISQTAADADEEKMTLNDLLHVAARYCITTLYLTEDASGHPLCDYALPALIVDILHGLEEDAGEFGKRLLSEAEKCFGLHDGKTGAEKGRADDAD